MTETTHTHVHHHERKPSVLEGLMKDPAVQGLVDQAKQYAVAKATNTVAQTGEKIATEGFGAINPSSMIKSAIRTPVGKGKGKGEDGVSETADEAEAESADDGKKDEDGRVGFKAGATGSAMKALAEGKSPLKAALSGIGGGIKGIFRRKGGGRGKRPNNIIEDVMVGVPVDVAYDQWTQYQEMPSYMKGPQSVSQDDDVTTKWLVKIGFSKRNFTSHVEEQRPDRRIKWTSQGPKGHVNGVITFHPLADDLTQVLLVMEYYNKGFFEWWGNRFRVVGRRARLDFKHYRRFVMMQGEATGEWRGTIENGEVTVTNDEALEAEEEKRESRRVDDERAVDGQDEGEQGEEPQEGEQPDEEEQPEGEVPEGEEPESIVGGETEMEYDEREPVPDEVDEIEQGDGEPEDGGEYGEEPEPDDEQPDDERDEEPEGEEPA